MQPFTCPECGHVSTFDPLVAPALCPKCGYTPPQDRRGIIDSSGSPTSIPARRRGERPKRIAGTHQRFLDELLAHWNGKHTPDRTFQLPDQERAHSFFQEYQRALGEDPYLRPGRHMRYVRNHQPERKEIIWFVGAYLFLRRGDLAAARQNLHDLTALDPDFADPWIWLTATTNDVNERIDYLENALVKEPAHPLAQDAMAIARGRIPAKGGARGRSLDERATTTQCPKCGGALHYEPGAQAVACQFCGHEFDLEETNLIDGQATRVGDLRLKRRFAGHTWTEINRIVHCQSCGAELSMTRHMAQQCLFCGSTHVLVEDAQQSFVQPDGFLPFQVNKDQAAAAILEAQRSNLQRLKTWWIGKERKIQDVQGVYLPFWVFDGFVEIRTQVYSRFDPLANMGGLSASTPTSDLMMFDNLLFAAMEKPDPGLLSKVLPFELGTLVPYEPQLLANWPAALYHRDVELAVDEAYDAMLNMARLRAGPPIIRQTPTAPPPRRTFQVTSVTYQLVLLPVWVVMVRREDRHRLVLVNGQSGKVAVSSPVHRAGA